MNENIRNQYKAELKIGNRTTNRMEWYWKFNNIDSQSHNWASHKVHNTNNIYCDQIAILSLEQNDLRQKISNYKKAEKKKQNMKADKNKILHQIWGKVKKHKEQLPENKLSDINNAKGNVQMFKTLKY